MTGTENGTLTGGHRKLRILAVHRYYWPDAPPYAWMLKNIVECWRDAGHDVSVLSSQPSYKREVDNKKQPKSENCEGILTERLSLPGEAGRPFVRISNAIRLACALIWRAMFRRYDIIMISTVPPVLGGVVAALACKLTKARFIYHCMDIQPEVGRISGEFSHSLVFRLLREIDSWTCRQANPVVVLSHDMAKTLRERPGCQKVIIKVLNNFSLSSPNAVPDKMPIDRLKDGLMILFAGNIGRFQGLDVVVEAMGILRMRSDIEFILMGEGIAKSALQERAIAVGARVRFLDHQPIEIARQMMSRADAGFVSLSPNIYRYAYPSKTMTYLEEGCPLIVAVEPVSELSRDVVNHGYGYCVPVGDPQALADLLEGLADDGSWKQRMRKRAIQKAADFSRSAVLKHWETLIYEVTG